MPQMQHVTVHNPDTHNSLHLLSISGSTLHFHCSFFQDKVSCQLHFFFFFFFLADFKVNVQFRSMIKGLFIYLESFSATLKNYSL